MRQRLRASLEEATDKASRLWHALLACDTAEAARLVEGLKPSTLAACARWLRRGQDGDVEPTDEATAPFGETLLHAAAFAGDVPLLRRLLESGAPPSRRGQSSGCTALHAAATAGHLGACKALLRAGCKVGAASVTKRTALHTACTMGLKEVAIYLVEEGADPYASVGGGESAMAMLRRLARPEATELHRLLDAISGEKAASGAGTAAARLLQGSSSLKNGMGTNGANEHGGGAADDEDADDEEDDDEDDDISAGDKEEAAFGITKLDDPNEPTKPRRDGRRHASKDDKDGGRSSAEAEDPGALIQKLAEEAELVDSDESGSDDDGKDGANEGVNVADTDTYGRLLRQAREAAERVRRGEMPKRQGGAKRRGHEDEDEESGEESEDYGEGEEESEDYNSTPAESDYEEEEE